jgi:hypothetical protein
VTINVPLTEEERAEVVAALRGRAKSRRDLAGSLRRDHPEWKAGSPADELFAAAERVEALAERFKEARDE